MIGDSVVLINRRMAIKHLKKRLYETALNNYPDYSYYEEIADNRVDTWLNEVPPAQPEIIRCKDCKYRGQKPISDGRYWCSIHDTYMYYCSDAERRTNEGD